MPLKHRKCFTAVALPEAAAQHVNNASRQGSAEGAQARHKRVARDLRHFEANGVRSDSHLLQRHPAGFVNTAGAKEVAQYYGAVC
jgi:hypothetical protein